MFTAESDYKKGDWQDIWVGVFWFFMDTHRCFFLQNQRFAMLFRMFDNMPNQKREAHLKNGEKYLGSLNF